MSINVIYRFYFLWLEPIFAVVGALQTFFTPEHFLKTLLPEYNDAITPTTIFLLTWLGSMYLFFAIIQGILLRQYPNDRRLWRTVCLAMILSDLGHLWAPTVTSLKLHGNIKVAWQIWKWHKAEWSVWGSSYIGLVLRMAFVMNRD